MRILIQNGHVLDPLTGRDGICDVLIEDEKIADVKEHICAEADKTIDAEFAI